MVYNGIKEHKQEDYFVHYEYLAIGIELETKSVETFINIG